MLSRKLIALSAIMLVGCDCPPDTPVCVEYHYEPNKGTKQRQPYVVCDRWLIPTHNRELDRVRP